MDNQNNDSGAAKSPANMNKGQHNNPTLMGILAYLGPLVIIPYVTMKDDPFVKFHIKQGLVLLVIEAGLWVLASILFGGLWILFQLLHLALLVLSIIGIINVVNKKQTPLPLVGDFAKHFTF